MLKNSILTLSGCLILAACTSFTPPPSNPNWQAETPAQNFTAEGRIGVKVADKGLLANFDWQRENGVENFDVNTPLGNTVGQLCSDKQGFIAIDHRGKRYTADTAAQLSQQLLGYELPITPLWIWANGQYLRNVPHQIDADGRLTQLGWTISRETDDERKPKIVVLQNKDLTLKLIFIHSQTTAMQPEQGKCAIR